jgi:hypothetical protein
VVLSYLITLGAVAIIYEVFFPTVEMVAIARGISRSPGWALSGYGDIPSSASACKKNLPDGCTCSCWPEGSNWPAPGSADTDLGVLMEPEVGHGETEVYPRVQG